MKFNRKKFLIVAIILLVTLLIDIFSKMYIRNNFRLYETYVVIENFFNLIYVLNPGAAFGILSSLNEEYRQLFFIIVSSLASLIVGYMIIKERSMIAIIGLSLILSGAIGNLIDRIHTGYVVDFLDFYIKQFHWYAFNVADICVTTGVALIVLDILFSKRVK